MAKKVAEPGKEAKDHKGISVRPLTDEEIAVLEKDDEPPAGYSNTTLNNATAEGEPPAEPPKEGEEPPAEQPPAPPAGEKTPEPPAAPAAPGQPPAEDSFAKLERELAKPEGKEDLSQFSPREKAYFHQMRRDRRARQKAEEERDQALFREGKLKKDLETRPPAPEADPFEGMADDEVISAKDARERLKKMPKPTAAEPPAAAPAAQNARAIRYLQLCEKEARDKNTDFDVVMELSDDLISNNPEALREISEATANGENPAQVMYDVIKRQKDFATLLPVAETRHAAKKAPEKKDSPASPPSATAAPPTPADKAKEDKAKQTEKALEDNANRTKTTAHVSAREGKPAEELTMEEIASMSDLEFAKLPRNVRNRYLKQYGG